MTVCATLILVALAGCLSDDGLDVPPPDQGLQFYELDVFPIDLFDHDHGDPLLHDATHNVELAAYHSCTSAGTLESAPGGFTDIAFRKGYAFVGTSQGFCVLDIRDPTQPRYVSSYQGEPSSDLEVSEDGNYAFLLTQRNPAASLLDPLGEPTGNLPRGVHVVNVANKANPEFESYYPVPTNGVHTATSYVIDGRQLLFIQSYDWVPPSEFLAGGVQPPAPQQNAPGTQRIEITELSSVNGQMVLQRLSSASYDRPATEPLMFYFPHDAVAQLHPVDNRHYLYAAYWDAGLVIYDVNDPENPALVSQFNDLDPSLYNAYHDVKVFDELIDGRHITVTGPELGESTEAGHVRIFDTTDPARPVQLGTWRLPENPGTPGGYLYSPHVFTLHDGRIYIGHNHAGVWVIDASNETLLHEPASAGFYFPRGNEHTGTFVEGPTSAVWGAYWHEGYVYATERTSGVHVLKFGGDV